MEKKHASIPYLYTEHVTSNSDYVETSNNGLKVKCVILMVSFVRPSIRSQTPLIQKSIQKSAFRNKFPFITWRPNDSVTEGD